MSTIAVSERLARIIDHLEAGDRLETKLSRVLENEIRRRLARYEWIDRFYQRKYGMTFEEFERNEMRSSSQKSSRFWRKKNYSNPCSGGPYVLHPSLR